LKMRRFPSRVVLTAILIILAQLSFDQKSFAGSQASQSASAPQPGVAATTPIVISLDEAIRRAEQNEPNFANAVAASGAAALDRSIARSALLPGAIYHNQYLYTQPNGARNSAGQTGNQQSPIYIANNAIREYASQGSVTETLGLAGVAEVKRANAVAAQAAALAEVARRGLVLTVVEQYYGLLAADEKLKVSERASGEAARFADLTRKLEQGQEVAHADVVKADLQLQQAQRDLEDSRLTAENARLELGILLFADPRTNYVLEDDRKQAPALPDKTDIDALAQRNNPDVRSAMEALRAAGEDVSIARAAYFPDLSLNWTYGIDAPQFATNGPAFVGTSTDGTITSLEKPRNLGYSTFVTLDIPVWDWFATHDRVKQNELKRTAAQTAVTYAQKTLLADLDEFYHEAEVAARQLASLDQSVQTATDSLRLTNLRYQAGEATALEVVDAQNALSLSEMAYANGGVRYRVALANLQTLTGVLP
jgi:outer membrane protein TolC